jgi:hypothetical protein
MLEQTSVSVLLECGEFDEIESSQCELYMAFLI